MLSKDVDISKGLEFFRTVYGPWLLHVTRRSEPDKAIAGLIIETLEEINARVRELEDTYRERISAVTKTVDTLIAETDRLNLVAPAVVPVPKVQIAEPSNVVAFPAGRGTPA